MDRSTLYLVTKFSTSSRSFVWHRSQTGTVASKLQQPKDRTGRPPRARAARQTQNLLNPRCSWAGEGWHLQVGWVSRFQVKVSHLKLSWTWWLRSWSVTDVVIYRLAGMKVVWTLSFPILRGKPQRSEHSSVLSLAGVTGTVQLCFSLLATTGLWHCELARKSQKCRNIPLNSIRQKYLSLKWKSAYHQV